MNSIDINNAHDFHDGLDMDMDAVVTDLPEWNPAECGLDDEERMLAEEREQLESLKDRVCFVRQMVCAGIDVHGAPADANAVVKTALESCIEYIDHLESVVAIGRGMWKGQHPKPKTDAERLALVDAFMLEEMTDASDEEILAEMGPDEEADFDAAFERVRASLRN